MKVLVADDDLINRRVVEVALEQRGHTPIAVSDGTAAWDAFEREEPPLVLLDWQMPGLDGLEVCRRIRASARARETFILMVAGRSDGDDVASAIDAGADDYLFKPFSPSRILARVAIAERRIVQNRARWAAEDELAKAKWMAGVGQTALAVQHEVNNPLAALLGNVQLMLMDDSLPLDAKTLAEEMLVQARRVANVVKRLSTLEDPRTVEYLRGATMLDLSEQASK